MIPAGWYSPGLIIPLVNLVAYLSGLQNLPKGYAFHQILFPINSTTYGNFDGHYIPSVFLFSEQRTHYVPEQLRFSGSYSASFIPKKRANDFETANIHKYVRVIKEVRNKFESAHPSIQLFHRFLTFLPKRNFHEVPKYQQTLYSQLQD